MKESPKNIEKTQNTVWVVRLVHKAQWIIGTNWCPSLILPWYLKTSMFRSKEKVKCL